MAGAKIEALAKPARERVLNFIYERLRYFPDPRRIGGPLQAPFADLWRYRLGDCRIICRLEDARLVVLVVRVGYRRDIYNSPPN